MASLTISYFLLLISILSLAKAGLIGVNYGRIANNLPQPSKVVELLKSHGINRIKLYDTDSAVLTAFANSGISVVVALPNELLSSAAANQSFTDTWIQTNISPFYPSTNIQAIAVGNEVFVDPKNTTLFLVPAMNNVYSSLVKYKIDSNIKISSPIVLSALQNSYPSSSGSFKPELIEPVIKPMLSFLRKTGSYLMVNVYPLSAYETNADVISLDYALFKENQGVVDSGNNLRYMSLFEAQIDAVFAAMSALQYDDVKMVVTETGWPSKGDENETSASEANAASYNGNLVRRVLTSGGSPLRPNDSLDVYLFALFNEDQKSGPTSERNYGLFYPNEEKVYDIVLTQEGINNNRSMPANESKSRVPATRDEETNKMGETWCVAIGTAGEKKLQVGLDFACGKGGVDCGPIQPGGTCYKPNTIVYHASYAFNTYYQKKGHAVGSCNFDGTAHVVMEPPKFGKCNFPKGN